MLKPDCNCFVRLGPAAWCGYHNVLVGQQCRAQAMDIAVRSTQRKEGKTLESTRADPLDQERERERDVAIYDESAAGFIHIFPNCFKILVLK
eukprot:4214984-Amphidinium_carterae.1